MKGIIFVLALCLGFFSLNAQDVYTSSGRVGYHKKAKKKGYDPDKLILGGGINAGFGGGNVNFGVSPVVGYRFTNNLSAGVGLGYQFYKYQDYPDQYNNMQYDYENIVFPSIWGRYSVYGNVYVTTVFEYDFINLKTPHPDYYTNGTDYIKTSVTAPCLLVGVGFKQPLGGRLFGVLEIMYDVLQQQYSPYYGQPILRIGFGVGM